MTFSTVCGGLVAANKGAFGSNTAVITGEYDEVKVTRCGPFYQIVAYKNMEAYSNWSSPAVHLMGYPDPYTKSKFYLRPLKVYFIDDKGIDKTNKVIYE